MQTVRGRKALARSLAWSTPPRVMVYLHHEPSMKWHQMSIDFPKEWTMIEIYTEKRTAMIECLLSTNIPLLSGKCINELLWKSDISKYKCELPNRLCTMATEIWINVQETWWSGTRLLHHISWKWQHITISWNTSFISVLQWVEHWRELLVLLTS